MCVRTCARACVCTRVETTCRKLLLLVETSSRKTDATLLQHPILNTNCRLWRSRVRAACVRACACVRVRVCASVRAYVPLPVACLQVCCLSACLHVCLLTFACNCQSSPAFVCLCVPARVPARACMSDCLPDCMSVCMPACMPACLRERMPVCMPVCMLVYPPVLRPAPYTYQSNTPCNIVHCAPTSPIEPRQSLHQN